MHNIQLVKIQPEERLAASSELNPASCLVTGCGEARGMGYWAATQVKGLSPEIFIVPEADVVVLTEGSTLIADSPIGTWQGDASPAGSETVARYQTDIMGTREAQSVLLSGVCAIKPINGKTVQTTLWESDQFIVPEKQGNACRGKGLAGARWPGRDTPSILRYGQGVSTKLWSITLRERRGCTPEEPDEGKLQVRFCEGAHSNLGAITSKKKGVLWALLDENKKNLTKSITVIAVVLSIFVVAMVGAASAKSLYVISDINANPTPIQSYDIQAAPTYLVHQTTNTVPYYGWGGVGLAIDTDSAMLFVTYEASNTIQLKNATTMVNEGTTTAPGAYDLAGVVVDQDKSKVYTMDRNTNKLYVYSWDASTKTLTLDGGTYKTLSGCNLAYGIALDEVNDLLYVGDYDTSVEYYNTADWSHAGSFTVSHKAMGIAVDVINGFVYSGSWDGNNLLSKYDLSTTTESTVNVGNSVLGLAVDPEKGGLVYITTYGYSGATADRLIVYDSSLTQKWISVDIGNPTGLCVPGKDISYNPLNFDKDDELGGACVNAGGTITYTLSYTNPTGNPDVTGVTIVDTLPSGVTYQSCTGGCTQSGNTVTWTIGSVAGGTSGSVTLTVTVNAGTEGTTITNTATIDSDQTPPTTRNEQTTVCGEVIPEFSTIAIPVASILGLLFFFNHRKRRREQ